VSGDAQVGDLTGAGRLGDVRFKTSVGHVSLERTGGLRLTTATGQVTVEHVAGNAEIHTSSGKVRVGDVDGSLEVKNSNGDNEIGAVGGEVRVRASNGGIVVARGAGNVDAKTSNGSIQVGEVVRGSVTLGTAMGDLSIGIAEGTAAWLEVDTSFGQVRNELTNAVGPEDADETVEVRAHTSFGAITIHRA
jgi:DUF4097 and DUF4098 domain-containing protein YvlB